MRLAKFQELIRWPRHKQVSCVYRIKQNALRTYSFVMTWWEDCLLQSWRSKLATRVTIQNQEESRPQIRDEPTAESRLYSRQTTKHTSQVNIWIYGSVPHHATIRQAFNDQSQTLMSRERALLLWQTKVLQSTWMTCRDTQTTGPMSRVSSDHQATKAINPGRSRAP